MAEVVYRSEYEKIDTGPWVNHPEHYNQGTIECIDAVEAALTPEEFCGFLKGNAIKYLWREKHKGNSEDLNKAKWYINRLTERP